LCLRYYLSRREPPGTRILLIESGSRSHAEGVLAHLLSTWGGDYTIDLASCYGGLPAGLPPDTIRELRARDYAYTGMICSGEPIMTKWKWLLALRVPAKVFIVNENGDYFWLNRENAAVIREFALVRAGLSGAGAARTLARLLAFPFTVMFLLLYALTVHARRILRTGL